MEIRCVAAPAATPETCLHKPVHNIQSEAPQHQRMLPCMNPCVGFEAKALGHKHIFQRMSPISMKPGNYHQQMDRLLAAAKRLAPR